MLTRTRLAQGPFRLFLLLAVLLGLAAVPAIGPAASAAAPAAKRSATRRSPYGRRRTPSRRTSYG
ncbi:hypothetical protein [Streptomyces sp. S4.7]|uniref:hypothetical protein n=1 Tax=Streptomyces sp. S4.7 TaxID=2705439 RepID=UPI0013DB9F02|nr:hypothetical protein [Streptomyces sp. S4.7]